MLDIVKDDASNNPANLECSINFWRDTLIVIVLYNTKLCHSATFDSLSKSLCEAKLPFNIDLLICDNSIVEQVDISEDNRGGLFNIRYLHDSTNPGVSQSYNRAAELAEVHQKKWLLLLDQDTTLPINAVIQYQKAVVQFPGYPIYAPQLYNGLLLFSPCRYWLRKGSNLSSIKAGVHLLEYRNVLNSGLLIDMNAFRIVGGYDEAVPLYFSDFVFFNRLKKHFRKFVVIDCRLDHQLSSVDYSNMTVALTRFDYYCEGALQSSRDNLFAYLNQYVLLGSRSLLMSYRFRSLKFLKLFIKNFKR